MPRPKRISRDKVVSVAIRLLDEEGVHGLSLDRIAGELGVRGPSLYHYYPDKAAILDDVAQHILGRVALDAGPAGRESTADWEEWMVSVCLDLFRRVMRHPNVAHLVLEHMSHSAVTAGFGRGAQMLDDSGVSLEQQNLLLQGPHFIVWGLIMHRTVLAAHPELQRPVDEAQWPALSRAMAADDSSAEEVLVRAVRAYFAGVLARDRIDVRESSSASATGER